MKLHQRCQDNCTRCVYEQRLDLTMQGCRGMRQEYRGFLQRQESATLWDKFRFLLTGYEQPETLGKLEHVQPVT